MKLTFTYSSVAFFKKMIKQTKEILQYHVNVIQSGLDGGKVTRFRSPSKKMRVKEANLEQESLQQHNLLEVVNHMKIFSVYNAQNCSSINFSSVEPSSVTQTNEEDEVQRILDMATEKSGLLRRGGQLQKMPTIGKANTSGIMKLNQSNLSGITLPFKNSEPEPLTELKFG